MLTASQRNLLVAAVFALWAVGLAAMGTRIQPEFFKPFSLVTAALGAGLAFFNQSAWKWRVWRGWLVRRPNIAGTWIADLRPTGGRPPLTGFMVVRQTLTSLSLRLLTAEASSVSLASSIVHEPDGARALASVYRSDPRLEVRDRSPIHNGALYLTVSGGSLNELVGHYWTDRASAGELRLHGRQNRLLNTFTEAQTAFSSVGASTK